MLVFAGSASPRLAAAICRPARHPAGRGETLRFSEGNAVRPRARERARPRRLPRAVDGLPGQRQLHGAALLDRRAQAGQRRVGDRRHAVLQLRQGRQEGRAAGLDPGAGVRRRHRGRRAPTGSSRWTCTRRRSRASSASRSTTSTRCRCCATPSQPKPRRPRGGVARRRLRQEGPALGRAPAGAAGHRRQAARRPRRAAEIIELIGDGRRARRAHRRRLHHLGRHAGRRGRALIGAAARARVHRRRHPRRVRRPDASGSTTARSSGSSSPTRVETQPASCSPKVEVVSVAPLFAEAIRRIDRRESISSLFTGEPAGRGR